jgi:hypothetical protein
MEEVQENMHGFGNTVDEPLVDLAYEDLCPGASALEALQQEWR